MASGYGRSYFRRFAYRPVPGERKSGIPAAVGGDGVEVRLKIKQTKIYKTTIIESSLIL